jgi:hypothetical protein
MSMSQNLIVFAQHADHASEGESRGFAAFRRLLYSPLVRSTLTASTPTHEHPPELGVLYSFDQIELVNQLNRSDACFVVHHGPPNGDRGICTTKLLVEHMLPFMPRVRGSLDLSSAQLAAVLSSRVRKWSEVRAGSGTIRLLAHGGWVNDRVLRAYAGSIFGGIDLSDQIELFASYEELALAARQCNDCIVFGLRPAYVDQDYLVPIAVNGVIPWSAGVSRRVPSMPIYLSWRADRIAPHQMISHYLGLVAKNLMADALAMLQMGLGSAAECGPGTQTGSIMQARFPSAKNVPPSFRLSQVGIRELKQDPRAVKNV